MVWCAFLAGACAHPVAGVLTLAPAGMHTSGTCVPAEDGTLTMSSGATVDSVAYVDAGAVTVTLTAAASSTQQHPRVALWFDGDRIGEMPVDSTEAKAFAFHLQARSSGPTALRIDYVTDARVADARLADASVPTLHLEKVVITEP